MLFFSRIRKKWNKLFRPGFSQNVVIDPHSHRYFQLSIHIKCWIFPSHITPFFPSLWFAIVIVVVVLFFSLPFLFHFYDYCCYQFSAASATILFIYNWKNIYVLRLYCIVCSVNMVFGFSEVGATDYRDSCIFSWGNLIHFYINISQEIHRFTWAFWICTLMPWLFMGIHVRNVLFFRLLCLKKKTFQKIHYHKM